MAISAFDLFKVGIGPSSSHTVGPMLAGYQFVETLKSEGLLFQVTRVSAEMYGSLGATGKGHGTPKAVLLGLEGELPDLVDVPTIAGRVAAIRDNGRLCLGAEHTIDYNHDSDFTLHRRKALPFHPNGMIFSAFDNAGGLLSKRTYFSVGGGFVVDDSATESSYIVEDDHQLPYAFDSAEELLQLCEQHSLSISELMLENVERLAGRHLVIFVCLQDPRLEATVDGEPASLDALARSVIADEFLRERRVVLERLRRLGVHCLDVRADRIGPALINRYLDIKRRELI